MRIAVDGSVSQLDLNGIAFSSVSLQTLQRIKCQPRAARNNPRDSSITDLAYTAGRVLVAGLAAGESPSSVTEFDFPFTESRWLLEIFTPLMVAMKTTHRSKPRSFNLGNEPTLLAGYVCTFTGQIPVGKIKDQNKISGTTVAELGIATGPWTCWFTSSMVNFLLMSNSARGVMKISTEDLEGNTGLKERVSNGELPVRAMKRLNRSKVLCNSQNG